MEKFIKFNQACEILGITRKTLYNWIEKKKVNIYTVSELKQVNGKICKEEINRVRFLYEEIKRLKNES